MGFLRLDIQKDGLTYCIEATTVNEVTIEALLTEDCDGWALEECTKATPLNDCEFWRIGRRKSWAKALAEALDILEQAANAR
jgi:hypothetical protein